MIASLPQPISDIIALALIIGVPVFVIRCYDKANQARTDLYRKMGHRNYSSSLHHRRKGPPGYF